MEILRTTSVKTIWQSYEFLAFWILLGRRLRGKGAWSSGCACWTWCGCYQCLLLRPQDYKQVSTLAGMGTQDIRTSKKNPKTWFSFHVGPEWDAVWTLWRRPGLLHAPWKQENMKKRDCMVFYEIPLRNFKQNWHNSQPAATPADPKNPKTPATITQCGFAWRSLSRTNDISVLKGQAQQVCYTLPFVILERTPGSWQDAKRDKTVLIFIVLIVLLSSLCILLWTFR